VKDHTSLVHAHKSTQQSSLLSQPFLAISSLNLPELKGILIQKNLLEAAGVA